MNDRAVRVAIERGATSVEDLTAHCAAATGCGGCWPALERLIAEHATVERHEAVVVA